MFGEHKGSAGTVLRETLRWENKMVQKNGKWDFEHQKREFLQIVSHNDGVSTIWAGR